MEQLKEGIEFKKILVLMRTLFDNWDDRNKFLAKRFFIRKWFMQGIYFFLPNFRIMFSLKQEPF